LRELYPAQLLYQFSQLSRQQAPWPNPASSQSKHIVFGQNIPYLPSSQEPPILQNPERVVRHTENERFDRSYQPNVALAPRQTILVKERDEREINERSNSVIKREIQIKQERPSTPNNEHSESRHNSPETTVAMETNICASGATVPPISPEGQSGSNEITSSTSPVPVSNSNNNAHHHQIPNKRESETPPSQPSPPTAARSHSTTTLIKTSPSVVVKVTTQPPIINGKIKTIPLIGNPEFELSTDTDEESLGEPDSSHNGNPPQSLYEFVASLLKTNSSVDHSKILDIIKYMEKEITQLKEAHKKEIRERQQTEEALRKENERLQHQLRNNNVSSVIAATASCLSSSSSSSSSSLSSSFSYDYERGERRNSIVEKQNVIIKPPKKSLLRIMPQFLDDSRSITNNNNNSSTSTTNINGQTPSIVIMPKSCEDAINNNSSKAYNNNSNNNDSVSNSSSTNIINGNQEHGSSNEKQQLQKTAVKTEKL
jgi:hypothetical protein